MKREPSFRDGKGLRGLEKARPKSRENRETLRACMLRAAAVGLFVGETLREEGYREKSPRPPPGPSSCARTGSRSRSRSLSGWPVTGSGPASRAVPLSWLKLRSKAFPFSEAGLFLGVKAVRGWGQAAQPAGCPGRGSRPQKPARPPLPPPVFCLPPSSSPPSMVRRRGGAVGPGARRPADPAPALSPQPDTGPRHFSDPPGPGRWVFFIRDDISHPSLQKAAKRPSGISWLLVSPFVA